MLKNGIISVSETILLQKHDVLGIARVFLIISIQTMEIFFYQPVNLSDVLCCNGIRLSVQLGNHIIMKKLQAFRIFPFPVHIACDNRN